MPEAAAGPSTMTKAQASARYGRLKAKAECIQKEDDFHALYLGTARNVLAAFPVPQSTGTSPVVLPDGAEVCATLAEMLPAPSAVFTDDYFQRPTYPIKVLFSIAEFYGFAEVEDEFMVRLALSDYEKAHKAISNQVWFAYVLGLDPSSARSVIDKFKNARSLVTHRPPGAPFVANSAPSIGPASAPPPSATHPSVHFAVGPALGPTSLQAGATPPLQPAQHPAPPIFTPPAQSARPTSIYPREGTPGTEDTRKATYVHQHFSGRKFAGDLSQSVELLLRDYETCARQHRLTSGQKADYFSNVLEGPALTFFLNTYVPGMTYEEISEAMKREYNSDSRQLQVQSTLEGLRLDSFMAANSLSTESEGLNKMVEYIERLAPQCPPGFRSNENKIRFLRSAVLGYEWALAPIRNIVTHRYKFNAFVTALHESLQLSNELKSARSPEFASRFTNMDEEEAAMVFFQRYGRHPRDVSKYGSRRTAPRDRSQQAFNRDNLLSFEEARRRNECRKCRAKWDPGHRCEPGSIIKNARNRLRQGEPHVHILGDTLLDLEEDNRSTCGTHLSVMEGEKPGGATDSAEDPVHELDDALLKAADSAPSQSLLAEEVDADIATKFVAAATNSQSSRQDFQ